MNAREHDAILAGLRLLATAVENGDVKPNDGDVGDILTNAGAHGGMTADELFNIGDAWAETSPANLPTLSKG